MSQRTAAPSPQVSAPACVAATAKAAPDAVGLLDKIKSQETIRDSVGLSRDFALLNPQTSRMIVLDSDEARAFLTRWLLQELAPALGIDVSKVEIRVNGEAAARTDAHGARGLAENGVVYLNPTRYRPAETSGRSLLAHEIAHIAQASARRRSPIDTRDSRQAAEREAERIARAFEARSALPKVLESLDRTWAAADSDLDQAKLAEAVSVGRAREIDAIQGLISGLWISDSDVFEVFKILEAMPFVVARAVVQALGKKGRWELCDNINLPHIQSNVGLVFACYDALSTGEFTAVDTSVLAKGPLLGLVAEVRAAASRTVQSLELSQLKELMRSQNGVAIQALLLSSGTRPLTKKEKEEQDASIAQTLKDEQDLAVQREELAKLRESEQTKDIVDQIRSAFNNRDLSPQLAAQRSVEGLANYQGPALQVIAEVLDQEGLLDVLFAHIPEWAFFGKNAQTPTLLALMQARLPSKNLDYVESLLSYGFFDWAVRDYEAKFAYLLLKLLPLSSQYRFRRRDNGKWFVRLVQNLPDDFKSSAAYQGDIEVRKATKKEIEELKTQGFGSERNEIDEKELYYDVTERHRRRLAQTGLSATVFILKNDFRQAASAGNKKQAYAALHAQVAAIGGAKLEGEKFNAADQLALEVVVHELDREGFIEKMFSELPDRFLFSETSRIATVKIMMARDPVRAQYHARELATRRFFEDWMVTDREAYLAYLVVKALPDEERAAFIARDYEAWNNILGEMSQDARSSGDLNMYIGDKEGTDRASVLGQLAQKSTWTAANVLRLDGLVRMAIAMTEHRFAFERSKEFRANEDATLKRKLVAKYSLYDPQAAPARVAYSTKILKGTKWSEEGLAATARMIWNGLLFLLDNDLVLSSRTLGGNKLDLNQAQDVMGGNIAGVRLAAPEPDEMGELNPDTNKLTVHFDPGAHALYVAISDLSIESVNLQFANTTFQTGTIRLSNLELTASYDTGELREPTNASLSLGSVNLLDMLVAGRDSMLTLSRLFLSSARIGAGTTDASKPGTTAPRGGHHIPIPILGPLAGLIYNIFRLTGWLGAETFTSEAKQGIGRGLGQLRALDMGFSSLVVEGFQTSGGQNIAEVKVADFALRAGLNKTTALRAKIASLDQRSRRLHANGDLQKAAALDEQRVAAEKELAGLAAAETRVLEIQQILMNGSPSDEERAVLQTDLNKLALESSGEMYLDVGSMSAQGVSGMVTADEPIVFNGVHGEGKSQAFSAGLGLQLLTPERLQQIAKGDNPKTLAEMGGELTVDLGNLHTGRLAIGGGIRSSKDIDERLKDLEPKKDSYEFGPLYRHLVDLQIAAVKYEQYVAVGISALDETQLAHFRRLRDLLTKEPDIVFGSIDLIEAQLKVDISGRLSVGAKEATLKNIRMPERGLSIVELKALNILASAGATGGLAGWFDPKENLESGTLSAESIRVSKVSSDFHGALVDEVTFTGRDPGEKLEIDIKGRGNQVRIGVSIHAVGFGIAPRIGMMKQHVDGLKRRQSTSPDPKTEAQIEKIEGDIAGLEELVAKRAAAWAMASKAKTDEEKAAATQAVYEADGFITQKLAQVSAASIELEGFGLEMTGAGDVLSMLMSEDAFNPLALLESKVPAQQKKISLAGTGPDHRVLKKFAIGGIQGTKDDDLKGRTAQGEAFEVGETKLDASVRREGDSIWVDVPQFSVASILLRRFDLTSLDYATGFQVWSDGQSGIDGIRLKGHVRLDSKVAGSRDMKDFAVAHAEIDDFRIEQVYANGLGFKSIGEKLEVNLSSGAIKGIYAQDLKIDLPPGNKPPVVIGKAGIEVIDHVALERTLVGGFEATGQLSAKNFTIEAVEDGTLKASLATLSAAAFVKRGSDGWARLSLADLGLNVEYKDGVLKVKEIHLGSLTVNEIDWRFGTKHIQAKRPAKLINLRASARIETDLAGKKEDPEVAKPKGVPVVIPSGLKRFVVTDFRIDTISADHLLYEDGDMRVEIGEADPAKRDPAITAAMRKFTPLHLGGLHAEKVEWSQDKGLVSAEGGIDDYSLSARYTDLKTKMAAGVALSGAGLTATMKGDGNTTFDPGKVDKSAGFFKHNGIDAKFTTGALFGALTLGPDFVQLDGFKLKDIDLPKAEYHAPDRDLVVNGAHIDQVAMPYLKLTYDKFEVNGEKAALIRDVMIPEIEIKGIRASSIAYNGTAKGKDDKGVDVTSTQDIRTGAAFIDRLRFTGIYHDAIAGLTNLNVRAENRDSSQPAFGVSGLTANLVKTVGKDTTKKRIAGNIQAKLFTGDNIKVGSVTLGKRELSPGVFEPVKRTTVEGQFHLTDLGWLNPDLTMTDEKGGKLTLGAGASGDPRMTIGKIDVDMLANGTLKAEATDLKARNLQLKRYKPGATVADIEVDIPTAELWSFAVSLKGLGTEEGLKLLALKAKDLKTTDLELRITKERKALTKEEVADALKNPSAPIYLEPLGGMKGLVQAGLAGSPGALMKDIYITNGIARTNVPIPTSFPPSPANTINVPIPLADVRKEAEDFLNAPPNTNAPKDLGYLDSVEARSSGLKLGSGRVAIDLNRNGVIDKQGDVIIHVSDFYSNDNTIVLPSSVIGKEVIAQIPNLHFSGIDIRDLISEDPAEKAAGKLGGKTGQVRADVEVIIRGISAATVTMIVKVKKGKIEDVELGDMNMLKIGELGKVAAPTLSEVNKKGVEGEP